MTAQCTFSSVQYTRTTYSVNCYDKTQKTLKYGNIMNHSIWNNDVYNCRFSPVHESYIGIKVKTDLIHPLPGYGFEGS